MLFGLYGTNINNGLFDNFYKIISKHLDHSEMNGTKECLKQSWLKILKSNSSGLMCIFFFK